MPNIAIVGAQWGDEGKGKIVDLLSDRFDVVARFQGGPNAGHTVTIGEDRYALHHVPSGVFRPEARIVIGNGTVMDLGKLIEELDGLAEAGIDVGGRLYISDRAHGQLVGLLLFGVIFRLYCPGQHRHIAGTRQQGNQD